MTVVEIGLCGVKPNHTAMDASTPEGAILDHAWGAVTNSPAGPHWAFGGLEFGDPLMLWGFFEFDSVEHHREFASTFGKEAVKDLPSILTHQVFQKHVAVEGDLREVLREPVVEVTFIYFSPEISEAGKKEVSTKVRDVIAEKLDTCTDVKAVTFGWSVENDFPVLTDEGKDDRTGAVLALFVGWSTVEAQKEFRKIHGDGGLSANAGKAHKVVHFVTRLLQGREFGGAEA